MAVVKQGVLILLSLLFVISCGGGGGGGGSAGTATTGITGVVSDMSGTPLENATVFVGDLSTLSDEDGEFTLAVGAGDHSLSAALLNYTGNNRMVAVQAGEYTTQNLKLASIDTLVSFDAASGADVKAKDALISLPSGSYKLGDGSDYNGAVTVRATYNKVTTANGLEAFPGSYLGQDAGGNTKVLQSYGFIDVTLESAAGEDLDLGDGATATLTYPMDENISETPASIPLWYFDYVSGLWIEDGVATYDALTNTYSGTVSHFSTWNLDAKFDGASLIGCIEDSLGEKVPLAQLFISTEGWSKTVTNNDASGEFELINAPSGIPLTVVAKLDDLSSNEQTVTLTAGQALELDSCLVLEVDSSELFATVEGRVVDVNGDPVASQGVAFYSVDGELESYQSQDNTDSEGAFDFTFKRADIERVKLQVYYFTNSQTIPFSNYYTIDPVKDTTDVGDIALATTRVDGCVRLEDGSSTIDDVTTLSDGTTTVDDGTTVLGSGYTSFGSDSRQLRVGSPYRRDGSVDDFDSSGSFSFVVPKDNLSHRYYAHVYDADSAEYTLTGSMDVLANVASVDLSDADDCIQLHAMKTASATASASVSSSVPVHLEISSPDNYHFVSSDDALKSKSFTVDANGEYVIKLVTDSYDDNVSGSISVTLGGSTKSLMIPDSATGEFWTGFVIESYDGEARIVTINEPYYEQDFGFEQTAQ